MDSFDRFIPGGSDPDGFDLDPAAMAAAGFAARPFPDYGNHDVPNVARVLGAGRADLWSWEYGRAPQHFSGLSPDEAGQRAFELGYASILVSFEAAQAHVWLPDHHEFFVIFGPPAVLEIIRSAGIFTYDYDEYAHEPYFAGKRSEFLVEAGRRYTIDPSGDGGMMEVAHDPG